MERGRSGFDPLLRESGVGWRFFFNLCTSPGKIIVAESMT
jgi:hypothetical protein